MSSDKLDEGTLREVKDDLLERLAGQQEQVGMLPLPDVNEKFIAPILRKVEVDHELDGQRRIVRAEAGIDELPDGGDGKVLPTGRVRGRRAPLQGTMGVTEAKVSRFAVDATTEVRRQAQLATLQRLMVRHLLELPEWKPRIIKAATMCGTHDGTFIPASTTCMDCTMRERKLKQIIGHALRFFGDPRTPVTKAFSIPDRNPLSKAPAG